MTKTLYKLTCSNCGNTLQEQYEVCPNCGAKEKKLIVYSKDTIYIDDFSEIKAKNHKYSSDKKLRYHLKQGFVDSQSTTNGRAFLTRVIDKDNDYYYEHVEDCVGNVIKHQEEPLSKHQGHGTAKNTNDNSHKPD